MQDQPLVSVIMPAYNAASFITTAIQSVLNQSYTNWELLVVNDGSKDETVQFVKAFKDPRIRYFEQKNQGVSAARNVGLNNMNGDFFCFLDADDAYPANSIADRLKVFENDDKIEFVDGVIELRGSALKKKKKVKEHTYEGNPKGALIRLDERCFFGPSWMIRVKSGKTYAFQEGLTHLEDLSFYYSISGTGIYKATNTVILYYRTGNNSAMSNLKGLENGYSFFFKKMQEDDWPSKKDLRYLRFRILRIMVLSYLRTRKIGAAISVFFRFLFL